MPDNYYSEVNENGVVTPFRDLAAFPRSEQAVLGASNFCDTSNAIKATNLVSAVNENGIVTFKDETTAKWSNSYIGKAHIENGKTYYIMTDTKNPIVYGRIALNKSATQDPSQSNTLDITVLSGNEKITILTPSVDVASFIANETTDIYLWYCNDTEISLHSVFSAGFMVALSADTPYVPYAMTNKELTEKVQEPELSNVDVNTLVEPKRYHLVSNITNLPSGVTTGVLDVIKITSTGVPKKQILWPSGNPTKFYIRDMYSGGTWSAWVEFSGTVM